MDHNRSTDAVLICDKVFIAFSMKLRCNHEYGQLLNLSWGGGL